MATLYLDHSIITHPASWKPVEDVLTNGKAQLVLSLWNLFEIGSASDKAQHGINLMHAVVALAYCDYFLVRDGFVFQCFQHVRKDLSSRKLATVFRDADELKKALV